MPLRLLYECELNECVHCRTPLAPRKTWHMSKTVQTLNGPVFVAGKSKTCINESCFYFGKHYYATGVLKMSLPYSTYGLDVLAFIGWKHEQEHRQLVEIQRELNQQGVLINERTVGKLYRQFLALVGGMNAQRVERLADSSKEYGGLIWAVDALQPEGHGTLLYVLYEVLSGTAVSAIQLPQDNVLRNSSVGCNLTKSCLTQCWQRCQMEKKRSLLLWDNAGLMPPTNGVKPTF